jgi:glycosyltransferase 2 family protein
MRNSLRTALVALVAIGLLALFLRNTDVRQVWGEVTRARPGLVAFSIVATGFAYLFRALRWQFLMQPIGRVSLRNAFRTTVIGFAASALLPARAGEVLRPWLLARKEGLSATAVFATIILERVLDTVMVLLLFGFYLTLTEPGVTRGDALAFSRLKLGGLLAAAVSVIALVVMFFLAGHPGTLARLEAAFARILPTRLAAVADRFVRTFAEGLAIVRQPRRLGVSVLLSLPLWLSIAAGIWLVSQAFHVDLPFTGSFLIMALLVVGVAVPTPGAVGGFHYFYRLGATAFYGAPNDRAVGAAIVLHAVSFVPVAILGLIFLAQEGLSLSRVGTIVREGGAEEAA